MQVIMIILYILLFVLCLSVLIVVHELGHFTVAKFFKVYCLEFSIGFGPALFHKKRKNGETYFSLRGIPFGGYVSMYGEGVPLPDGVSVDASRSFNKIKKWKRILILFAGVFNNAILALILFFISESACVQKAMYLIPKSQEDYSTYTSYVEVIENTPSAESGIKTKDAIHFISIHDEGGQEYQSKYFLLDKNALVTYNDNTTEVVASVIDTSIITYNERNYIDFTSFYHYTNPSTSAYDGIDFARGALTASESNLKSVTFSISISEKIDSEIKNYPFTLVPVLNEKAERVFLDFGLKFYLHEYYNDIGTAFQQTFVDFGDSACAIVKGLGSLFTQDGWKNVGGIISIGVQTTNVLQNMGIGKFLYVWGLISVNLGIINLLPFPGLDGWQILVLAVEMIFHKEIPEKVKNVISYIGLILLFALMIMIVIKDIIGLL